MTSDPANADPIWIVLSTYRPNRHLEAQIESIRAQRHANWRLLIRTDDGDPETAARLLDIAALDDRIDVLDDDDRERLGTTASYSRLLECARRRGAQWVALADQDDLWRPEHLASGISILTAQPEIPTMVHGDLEVIDDQDRILSDSFFRYQNVHHEAKNPLRVLVLQNFVTGCSSFVNGSLLDWALPIPGEAVMHDAWLAACAAASGRILCTDAPTVRYRQHADNQVGAKPHARTLRSLLVRTLTPGAHDMRELEAQLAQMYALGKRIDLMPRRRGVNAQMRESLDFIREVKRLFSSETSRLACVRGLARLGVHRQSRILDLSLKLKLLITRRD